ncbi:uncharacterized protein [Solanum tuberosum]|uniref:uncharacterized protein n=1 Tax=Solanum tuberosum TaxID=4113 RepID=UPI00073A4EBC|nr:PREDICTED: uncharacterized protein LOC107061494 [Solanum tuberosum]
MNFKRSQQKMLFYLTTLSLQRFIKESVPELADSTPKDERIMVIEAWKHSNFICKNYILNGIHDDFYNVYSNMKTSKDLWDAIGKKYKTEDAGLKKFIRGKVSGLQDDLVINEAFQVAAIIDKLPPLWKDFKNNLKHKLKEMSLEDLIVRLRIEKDNKAAEKRPRGNSTILGANIVEYGRSKKRKANSAQQSSQPEKKFKGSCFNCGKNGHRAANCKAPKKVKKKDQANVAEFEDDDL